MEINLRASLRKEVVRQFAEKTTQELARLLAQQTGAFTSSDCQELPDGIRSVILIEEDELVLHFKPGTQVVPVLGLSSQANRFGITSEYVVSLMEKIVPAQLERFMQEMVQIDIL